MVQLLEIVKIGNILNQYFQSLNFLGFKDTGFWIHLSQNRQ